jgi:hypothetical protein
MIEGFSLLLLLLYIIISICRFQYIEKQRHTSVNSRRCIIALNNTSTGKQIKNILQNREKSECLRLDCSIFVPLQ